MSQDGLLLSSQCKRQPSHLEATEWDLYRPSAGYPCCLLLYVHKERRRRKRRGEEEERRGRRGEGGGGEKGILAFASYIL